MSVVLYERSVGLTFNDFFCDLNASFDCFDVVRSRSSKGSDLALCDLFFYLGSAKLFSKYVLFFDVSCGDVDNKISRYYGGRKSSVFLGRESGKCLFSESLSVDGLVYYYGLFFVDCDELVRLSDRLTGISRCLVVFCADVEFSDVGDFCRSVFLMILGKKHILHVVDAIPDLVSFLSGFDGVSGFLYGFGDGVCCDYYVDLYLRR